MAKTFASQGDLSEKKKSLIELAKGVYGYTAEGDPNSGFIIGENEVMVIEAQATPQMANELIEQIRTLTDKPIKYLVLTHYHAVRVLGASAYQAQEIIASTKTYEMIVERGQQDWNSEFQRFPRLFRGADTIPGLTWPTLVFDSKMTVFLGKRKVEIIHPGEGHTRGDTIVWLPEEKVLFAGDLVEYGATPYCGDAQLQNWPKTLQFLSNLNPHALVPGRGEALTTPLKCQEAIFHTNAYVQMLYQQALLSRLEGETLKQCYDRMMETMEPQFGHWVIFKHCMPFNVSRAYDEAGGINHPRIWTAQRDIDMWEALEKDE
ncbi:MAG: MBL fold metallo-hydrolase [Bacteroidetes bacterium]|nr:MBL fold metallo-hydrolase [Bacteroidota bacterium]MCB0844012.1 MBL fold metallo-hydrolase [Bacteroidota bacterium]